MAAIDLNWQSAREGHQITEDGTNLISQLRNKVEELKNQFKTIQPFPIATEFHSYPLTPNALNSTFPMRFCLPFNEQLGLIISDLYEIFEHLEDKTLDDVFFRIVQIFLETCDDLLSMCTVYLEFVYPMWAYIIDSEALNPDQAESERERTFNILATGYEHLELYFSRIFEDRSGEPPF